MFLLEGEAPQVTGPVNKDTSHKSSTQLSKLPILVVGAQSNASYRWSTVLQLVGENL